MQKHHSLSSECEGWSVHVLHSCALQGKKSPRRSHLFSSSPPASSCIWAASHAKRRPVPVQLPPGVWGAPLQRDMCYWLEARKIKLENADFSLFVFASTSSPPPPSLSHMAFPFSLPRSYISVYPVLSRFLLSIWLCFHQRDRERSLDNWAVHAASHRSK